MPQDIVQRELMVDLNVAELDILRDELARMTAEIGELEDRKKSAASHYKGKIDACLEQSRVMARKITTRTDYRQVDCRWFSDFDTETVKLVRLDTGEVVDSRRMSESEKQMPLSGTGGSEAPPPAEDGAGDAAGEAEA